MFRENEDTNFVLSKLSSEIRVVSEKMWKNIVQPRQATDDDITWRMYFGYWIIR